MLPISGLRALLCVLTEVLLNISIQYKDIRREKDCEQSGQSTGKATVVNNDSRLVSFVFTFVSRICGNLSKMANNTSVPIILATLFPNCVTALTGGAGDNGNSHKVTRPGEGDTDNGAVIYIIAVLMFYSTGVVVMIIQYLKTEKKELEEEVNLEKFFKEMPDGRVEREHHVNQVAIRAFHTLTSISYEDSEDDTSPRTVLVTDL